MEIQAVQNQRLSKKTLISVIPANNFSISAYGDSGSEECNVATTAFGVPAEDATAIPISIFTQNYGLNVSYGDGTAGNDEEIAYFCLPNTLQPLGLSAQDYSTDVGDIWILSVVDNS